MGFLLLGLDSLIACFAIGALLDRRAWLPFAALFGVFDAAAFLIGSAFSWEMPETVGTAVELATLAGLGIYLIMVALGAKRVANTRWVWLLPVALTVDNITYGLIDHSWTTSVFGQAGEMLISSTLMGLAGLALSASAVRLFPSVQRNRVLATGLSGVALLIAAPILLLAG